MKAFLVGFLFLILVILLTGVFACMGFLLLPFLFMLGMALRIIFVILLFIFGVWLLGKLIILIWQSLKSKSPPRDKSHEESE